MPYIRPIAIALLSGLVIAAHFSLGRQAENNGTFPNGIAGIFEFDTRTLPNTTIPIRLPKTGLAPLDNFCTFMVYFFHATLDPRNVRAHIQGHPLLGTLSSIWILMLAETHRSGRSVGFVVVTYVFEVMGELLGIGMFTPVWCGVHLVMTDVPASKGGGGGGGNFLALGWAVVLGHVVPTVMFINCRPDGEGVWSQQIWSILRLFHPVYVFTAYKVLTLLSGAPRGRYDSGPRTFYTFSILASGLFHVSAMGLLLAQYWIPGWVREEVSAKIDILEILVPYPYWQDAVPKVVPFEIGVATFLQWDNILSATAIVVWAAALYLEAVTLSKVKAAGQSLHTIIQAAGVTILAGPAAAAAFFVQERDSMITSIGDGSEKKRQ